MKNKNKNHTLHDTFYAIVVATLDTRVFAVNKKVLFAKMQTNQLPIFDSFQLPQTTLEFKPCTRLFDTHYTNFKCFKRILRKAGLLYFYSELFNPNFCVLKYFFTPLWSPRCWWCDWYVTDLNFCYLTFRLNSFSKETNLSPVYLILVTFIIIVQSNIPTL